MAKKKPKTELARSRKTAVAAPSKRLVGDVRRLIEQSRQEVAKTVNSAIVWLHWHIGKRMREDILDNQRAGYGEQIVSSLSAQLTAEYGRGSSRQNLFRMIHFAEVFPGEEIVSSLMRQLSWTHLIYIIPLDDPLKRDFYAEMCRLERWSVRTLRAKIGGMLFERTALVHELKKRGRRAERQVAVPIEYDGIRFDEGFRADVIVEGKLILELKSVESVPKVHKKQLLTYLRLADKRLGLLINFGAELIKDGIFRVVNGLVEDE